MSQKANQIETRPKLLCCCEHNQRLASSTSLAFLLTTVLWSLLVHIIEAHPFPPFSLPPSSYSACSLSRFIIILALFISLYPVSFLSFVQFYNHLYFSIFSSKEPRWLIVYAIPSSHSFVATYSHALCHMSWFVSYNCETGLVSNAPRT